ncbi:Fe-Mn family superoxide dismutase [Luteimonas sp. MC1895]|uniref:superoxide dismutase n=1 Tax=Luteimonas sp. MC1895 TaxID=2819513 RepID=UPI0018F06AEE|nr:Fe-Mn family superoxide dismutase [Luteimonas sp. MC1895]MBJ6978777.1 superoxide dismutase [Luteimonas sp. MC1895]
MPIELAALPWDRTALEPHLSGDTLDLQHGRHQRAHVDAVNALAPAAGLGETALEDLVRTAQGTLQAHAAQAWNLAFQWRCLKPAAAGGGGEPQGALADAIVRRFGDATRFRQRFATVALALQGSGWAWLLQRPDGTVSVAVTCNTASPITGDDRPLFGLNLWEHAYVLDYREARGRYVEAVWNVVDWAAVASHMR